MRWSDFIRKLGLVTFGVLVWGFGFSRFGQDQHTLWMYVLSVVSFVIFSYIIFLYAANTSKSDYLFSYNNVVVASFLFKLILAIGIIILFEHLFSPPNKNHVLHFIFVYICFTVYEVYFLTKLAKSSA
jgi:hypothetical protein